MAVTTSRLGDLLGRLARTVDASPAVAVADLQSGRLDVYLAYMLIAVIALLAVVTAVTEILRRASSRRGVEERHRRRHQRPQQPRDERRAQVTERLRQPEHPEPVAAQPVRQTLRDDSELARSRPAWPGGSRSPTPVPPPAAGR